ncbi:YdeI/OmpD-associated family protein [Hahella aquimaris]|uniref:YdeI/OmpD-associated family protein n=1 Tax=Hahella sp. HNIBRBA332 TaxID=3015983 RepID=UPI00273B5079|nr:YdeI/OmpD-associated family protein [Hahella sp. HNIBRBA332]WLQ16700.1 YdeI/OmpD-associated family protein [Hahella sp. HNIBRBA332]
MSFNVKQSSNPKVDGFLDSAGRWSEELTLLRRMALDCELVEELKWGKPCYTSQQNNIVILQGFKDFCALLFPKGALLKDPQSVLEKPGENTQSARRIPFANAQDIADMEAVIKAYIHEAVEVENAGLKVDFKTTEAFNIPEELQEKLDEIPAFRDAFNALTPGRQRGYLLHFSAPKQSKTRASRVARHMQQIMDGKGLNDR